MRHAKNIGGRSGHAQPWGALGLGPRHQHPPQLFGPCGGGGGGSSVGWGAAVRGARVPQHTYLKITSSRSSSGTYMCGLSLKRKLWYPLGGPSPAARFGGLGGGGEGLQIFQVCIHIWIPHKILSIFEHTHPGGKQNVSPHRMLKKKKQLSGAFGASLGPNVVRTSSTVWPLRIRVRVLVQVPHELNHGCDK